MPTTNQKSPQICNAKTRQGTPCQNEGNKTNGRCYLHGGNSTGAKTAMGKLKSSQNARKKIPSWSIGMINKKDVALIDEAINSARLLVEVVESKKDVSTKGLVQFIEKHRIALEVMKFVILEQLGEKTFVITQSALDFYYQEKQGSHLECHLFYHHHSSPYFPRSVTSLQLEYADKLLEKEAIAYVDEIERS